MQVVVKENVFAYLPIFSLLLFENSSRTYKGSFKSVINFYENAAAEINV